MAVLKEKGGQDIIVICGGIIPPQDHEDLYTQGVSAIFGPGTPLLEAAQKVIELLERKHH
jgi:methylmalonyl-CoA mutase